VIETQGHAYLSATSDTACYLRGYSMHDGVQDLSLMYGFSTYGYYVGNNSQPSQDQPTTDPAGDNPTGIGYSGFSGSSGSGSSGSGSGKNSGTANTIRVRNLLPGGSYYFAARAYDKSGNVSERSNEVTANLLRNMIINYWWILLILGGLLLAAIIYLLMLKKKQAKVAVA